MYIGFGVVFTASGNHQGYWNVANNGNNDIIQKWQVIHYPHIVRDRTVFC